MTTKAMPLVDLNVTAIQVLCREIGPVNTARFIGQFTTGFGNYSDDREQIVGDRTVKELATEIKRARTEIRMTIAPFLLCVALQATAATADDQWSRFRGPDGSGISAAQNLPVKWSPSEVRWKVELPGTGNSSPVVWKDRVFVTSGNEETAERFVTCVRAADGKALWQQHFPSTTFTQNPENSFASSTPAVDENGVYLYWTTPDAIWVTAVSLDGQVLWKKNLGPYKSQHGSGASLILFNHLLWINNDQDGPSTLLALDAKSGEIRHTIDRQPGKASYGTPCVLARDGRPSELIFAASSHGLTSVNPVDGTVNWDCTKIFPARIVGSPIANDGLVVCGCGEGGIGRRLVAVRPPTDKNPAAVVYDLKTDIPYVPTPLAKDGRLYLLGDQGLIRCLRTATGEPVWQQKLKAKFYGSPVWAEGRLYCVSKGGVVFVIAAGDKFELLAQNDLGEASNATPAIVQGTLYLRTVSHLVAVGGKKPE